LKEVNTVYAHKHGLEFWSSICEPAGLFANNLYLSYGLLAAGYLGIGQFKFVLGYNILWFAIPFLPFWTYQLYQWKRQPKQHTLNAYNYILAKREASAALELN